MSARIYLLPSIWCLGTRSVQCLPGPNAHTVAAPTQTTAGEWLMRRRDAEYGDKKALQIE